MLLESEETPVIKSIDIDRVQKMSVQRFWLHITSDGIGTPVYIPLIIIRGRSDGTIVGVTAVVHGNELNGISVVQNLINQIDPATLDGVLICLPVTNVPAFLQKQRYFPDGVDLNRIMPGNQLGNESEVYAYRLISRVINEFDILIDLHTASFGHINSYYVRANMTFPEIAQMAWLLNPQIIVHKESQGTLRYAAESLGIHALTVEIGDPNRFQKQVISSALDGIKNILVDRGMLAGEISEPSEPIVECESSFWLYTDRGGLLEVFPKLAETVEKGEPIARITNIFGDTLKTYKAPGSGIVIGKSSHPVNPTGGRILHLGIPTT